MEDLDFEAGDLYCWSVEPGKQKFCIPNITNGAVLNRGQLVELRDFLNKVLDKMPGPDTIDT